MEQLNDQSGAAGEPLVPTEDGIYFGLPENVYFKIERLSASGMNDIIKSPATFWARSWMNPEKEERESSVAQVLGSAYHCLFLENDQFRSRYCEQLTPEMIGNCLTSDAAIKAELKNMGQPQTAKGETVIDRGQRLLDAGFDGYIWHIEEAKWQVEKGSRIPIPTKYWEQMLLDYKRLEEMPEISDRVKGGCSEVTILHTCPKTGVKMKCRIDKLKADEIIDMKTYSNSSGKPVARHISDATMYNGYFSQATSYWDAVEFVRNNPDMPIFGATDEDSSVIAAIQERKKPLDFHFFFREKDGVPNLFLVKMDFVLSYSEGGSEEVIVGDVSAGHVDVDPKISFSALYMRGEIETDHAKMLYQKYLTIFGADTWYPTEAIYTLDGSEFPDFFMNKTY